ncbi:Indole-3-acetaldehyde oxidase-like [Homarus americanus]|uniref:Indole-3-acetaldehyde oxidase-like n=1 Tax=Homarus americanus TaxID=6706 RepID=A0A8J5SZH6_HOMAM|nr:Indole-3-acetaldehyde oxidase-like [Homarus americanus]
MGANVSLSRAIEVFEHVAATYPGYQYLRVLQSHWKMVANVSVRNAGSWAGNLMLKHKHPEFPSDIFLTLLGAGAQLTVNHADSPSAIQIDLEQFLQTDMSKSVILSVTLPPLTQDEQIRTFKISSRAVNAHAHVNACFKMELDPTDGYRIKRKPLLLFGGINPDFIHAVQTETYLVNKRLTDVVTVVEAAKMLGNEMKPDAKPQDTSPEYRISLSQCLFYKAVIGFLGNRVSSDIRSAGSVLERPLSSSEQDFDMNQDTWPVGKGIPKLESTTQISGEAVYLDDIPLLHNELHGAFIQSTVANAKIKSIKPSEALAVPGVVSFVTAQDIPGRNSFVVNAGGRPDSVFVGKRVSYNGQAIGLIVADTRDIALRAAKLVQVEYEDIKKPVLTIEEALKAEREEMVMNTLTGKKEPYTFGNPEDALKASKHKLIGEIHQGSQFHLALEALAGRVIPIEDGYDVFSTTQWPTETQAAVAQVLDIPAHSINISVRRLGGGYGGKISRENVVVTAAAVAAKKVKQPVRVTLDLSTNMTLVGFNDDGKFESLKVDMISDGGYVANEVSVGFLGSRLQNVYYIPNLLFRPIIVKTDTAANTWCRTPGTVEAVATVENVIEHVANYLKKDPLEVRMVNMVPPAVPRLMASPQERNVVKEDILPLLKQKAMYSQRVEEIKIFNMENLWKKRGMSIVPLWYQHDYPPVFSYGIQVSIYEHDGTVAVSHGGIEMGQGINTKVAQVVAYKLGIPIDKVILKASDTMVGANSIVTGGSYGTDLCAHGAKVVCEGLLQRINVVKEAMKKTGGKDPTWLELIKKCYTEGVDLCQRYWTAGKEHPDNYEIWAACCLEVEIDVLTGQYLLRRADIIEDCGRSMNPYVDIGQVEGAFIMGLGLYTSEEVKFDTTTGQKLTNGTWVKNAVDYYYFLPTGEPALCCSYVVVTALRNAITAFRSANGNDHWFDMDTPITVEKVHQLCGVRPEQFMLSAKEESSPTDFSFIIKDQIPKENSENFCPLN